MSFETETSLASVVLLGKTRCMLVGYSQFETEPNGCIALHYSVHFLRIFSFVTRGIESEGIGPRSVQYITPAVHLTILAVF